MEILGEHVQCLLVKQKYLSNLFCFYSIIFPLPLCFFSDGMRRLNYISLTHPASFLSAQSDYPIPRPSPSHPIEEECQPPQGLLHSLQVFNLIRFNRFSRSNWNSYSRGRFQLIFVCNRLLWVLRNKIKVKLNSSPLKPVVYGRINVIRTLLQVDGREKLCRCHFCRLVVVEGRDNSCRQVVDNPRRVRLIS